MDSKFSAFLAIMLFYIFLSYLAFPLVFYSFVEKSLVGAGNGFIVGSIVSVLLWVMVGRNMVK